MRWEVPRELLWALVTALMITVVALWPTYYPYGPTELLSAHRETEFTILSIKPGEWLLSIVTFMLWGATVSLVRSADRTAEKQLRAYFDLRSATVEHFEIGEYPEATLKFKNVGQTPALDVQLLMNVQVRDYGNAPPEMEIVARSGGSRSTIGRDGKLITHLELSSPLSEYSYNAVQNHAAAFYAWGIIQYRDTFGHNRYLRFRMELDGKKLDAGELDMRTSHEGNDSN